MKGKILKFWNENRVNAYIVIGVVLLALAEFGLFYINVTIGPISLSIGSQY